MTELQFVVIWYLLATGVPVFSSPMNQNEAFMVYWHGNQSGTSHPTVEIYDPEKHKK